MSTQKYGSLYKDCIFVVAAIGALIFPLGAQALPEAPSIDRSVTERENNDPATFTKPHISPFHTTADGRVALDIKPHAGDRDVDFYLIVPEKLTTHFIDAAPGTASLFASTTPYTVDATEFVSEIINDSNGNPIGDQRHVTLIDKTREFDQGDGYTNNPVAENGKDVYYITIHSTVEYDDVTSPNDGQLRHQFTPIKVTVANPKTVSAEIEMIEILNGKVASAIYTTADGLLETRFTNDGKLLVGRIGTREYSFYRPDTGVLETSFGYADIVYAYSFDGSLDGDSALGNVDGFDNLIPITFAPYDPRIKSKYGFAMFPFRDGEGNPIPAGYDLQGSYPWIDSEGTNIAFTTIARTLNPGGTTANARYPNVPYVTPEDLEESNGNFQGVSVPGPLDPGKNCDHGQFSQQYRFRYRR